MAILFVLIPLSLALAVIAVGAFFWAAGDGQFDDLDSPAWLVLGDDEFDSGENSPAAVNPLNLDAPVPATPAPFSPDTQPSARPSFP